MTKGNFKKTRSGVVLSSSFIIIMSFLLVIMIIALSFIFEFNIFTNVATGHLNMQYSTDAGRELILLMSSDCEIAGYENYNIEDLIGVYVSGSLSVKESIHDDLTDCIVLPLVTIADVNKGDEDIHYMYFYVLHGGQKYLEIRRPNLDEVNMPVVILPWVVSIPVTVEDGFPKDPRYYSETMNDMFRVQIPLADTGNMQFGSATAVLEEWSDEPWTTLTTEQQRWSDDYEN